MTDYELAVQAARAELRQRPKAEIEGETARTWMARAVAALDLAEQAEGPDKLQWIADAVEYGHEAVEHAASAGLGVLREVRARLSARSRVLFGGPL